MLHAKEARQWLTLQRPLVNQTELSSSDRYRDQYVEGTRVMVGLRGAAVLLKAYRLPDLADDFCGDL